MQKILSEWKKRVRGSLTFYLPSSFVTFIFIFAVPSKDQDSGQHNASAHSEQSCTFLYSQQKLIKRVYPQYPANSKDHKEKGYPLGSRELRVKTKVGGKNATFKSLTISWHQFSLLVWTKKNGVRRISWSSADKRFKIFKGYVNYHLQHKGKQWNASCYLFMDESNPLRYFAPVSCPI